MLFGGVVLLSGACSGGGDSSGGVADVAGATTTAAATGGGSGDPVAYAKCMRANGVPDFPDPDSDGRFQFGSGGGIDPNSAQFKEADGKCQQYAPAGGKTTREPVGRPSTEEQLKYSQCMRANGVPQFPDPGADGQMPPLINGIDPESPQFKKADEACKQYAPQGVPKKGGGNGS